jgi:hypothetical protein
MKKDKFCFIKYKLLSSLLIAVIMILVLPILAIMPPSPGCIFGSKVYFTDADEGNPLNFCCHGLGYNDIGREKDEYDESDPVYLDMDADKIISVNDIRITPFATPLTIYMPGSKVKRIDADINAHLRNFINWSIAYLDLNGDNVYSLRDPLYLHDRIHGNHLISGDIRLTFFQEHYPGSRVINYSPDANLSSVDLMGINTTNGTAPVQVVGIRFFNVNGNYLDGFPIYDLPDAVYLNIIDTNKSMIEDLGGLKDIEDIENVKCIKGIVGSVGANDLRLTLSDISYKSNL